MREVSIEQLQRKVDDDGKREALQKIQEGLELLAKINAEGARDVMAAIREIPVPELVVDLSGIEKMIEAMKPEPVAYSFEIKRDSTRTMTGMVARPL